MSNRDQVILGIAIAAMCIGFGMAIGIPVLGIILSGVAFVILLSVQVAKRLP